MHERTSWRVDGGFPEGKLASVALREGHLGVLIVLLISDVWSSLVCHYCFAALSHLLWSRQRRAPTPSTPTSHLRSIHPKATGLSTVATNPHTPHKVTAVFEFADTTNHDDDL